MKRTWLWGLLGGAVLVGLVAGWWFWSRNPYAKLSSERAQPAISKREAQKRPVSRVSAHRLTETRRAKYDPAWSLDGRYLAYLQEGDEVLPGQSRNPAHVMVTALDGSGQLRISQDPVASGGVEWTRDNSLLMDLGGVFILANTNGEVTNHWYPPINGASAPAVVRDRNLIYFTASVNEGGQRLRLLYSYNMETGEFGEVSRQPEPVARNTRDQGPRVSSTGNLVAFPVAGEAGSLIVIVEARTGKKVGEVTDAASFATWAPRGDRLAYTSKDGEVVLVDFVGGRLIDMRQKLRAEGRVTFSPDGHRLAYAGRKTEEGSDLYVLDLAKNRLIRLAPGFDVSDPAWSPDGGRIAVIGRPRSAKGGDGAGEAGAGYQANAVKEADVYTVPAPGDGE